MKLFIYTLSAIKKFCVKKIIDLKSVLKEVRTVIIFVRTNLHYHRQFCEILEKKESSAADIIYHTVVRWLSRGETALRVLNLQNEIIQLYATKFLISFVFLVVILAHVNQRNQVLQGKCLDIYYQYERTLNH